jgi:fibronectin type 3 domain-containing protein
VATVPANTPGYSDTSVTPLATFIYRVRAASSYGPSDWSNEAVGATADPPAAPIGLVATPLNATQIQLTWTDKSDNEQAFEVWRKSSAGDFVRIAALAPNTTYFVNGGLTANTSYTYRVRATRNMGASAWSNEVTATAASLPVGPSSLRVFYGSLTQLNLTWMDHSNNETGFEIQRRVLGGDWATVAALPADTTGYADSGLTPFTIYLYRVRAINGTGPSGWSGVVSAVTANPPAAPTGLEASAVSSTQVNLSWTDNATTETAYEVYRQTGGGMWVRIAVLAPDTTSYSDRSVTAGTTYTYQVRATSNEGASAYSNPVSATTPAGP